MVKNTHLAKTMTASLSGNARDTFARISDPNNLSSWYSSFCRSLRWENGSILVESPRGTVPVHFIRDDHSLVLDIAILVAEGIKLTHAIRLLPNGESSEIVWTVIKPEGLADSIFHEQLRWVGNALHNLRKPVLTVSGAASVEPSVNTVSAGAAPSTIDVPSAPTAGKKLFIGNLSYDWADEQLRAHFAELGTVVNAEVARFRGRNGRSRGFGFVEMTSEGEAQSAIEKLHGGMAGGRQIIVRLAKSQESRPAKPEPDGNTLEESDRPEPGNERFPPARASHPRSQRPRRGGKPRPSLSERPLASRRGPARRPASPDAGHSYRDQDITNKNGYEIFPRRTR